MLWLISILAYYRPILPVKPPDRQDDAVLPGNQPSVHPSATEDFMSLFLEDQRRIHGYIIALLGTHQDAEDLLQETAAVLWRRFGEFERGTNFFAWACKTAHLIVLGYRRRKGRESALLSEAAMEKIATCSHLENSLLTARTSAFEECLKKLRDADRQLVERCYSPGVRTKQVAEEIGRAETSVYKSLGRIRRTLADCVRRSLAAAEREGGRL